MLLHLLPELQEMVLWYCNSDDLKNLTCCNHQYKDALEEVLWHTVSVPFTQIKEQNVYRKAIENFKHTKILHFGSDFGSMYVAVSRLFRSGTVLQHCNPSVIYTSFLSRELFFFDRFDKLTDLYLTSYASKDETLETVGDHLKGLKLLSVSGSAITDGGLSSLNALKRLETLDINQCNRITDVGLLNISTALPLLKEVDLSDVYKITEKGLSYLCKLIYLQKLNISNCYLITDTGLLHIATILTLKELNISGCHGISDAGLQNLTALINLETIHVKNCCKITDTGLLRIAAIRNIRRT